MRRISIRYKKKTFPLDVKVLSSLGKFTGLMFRSRNSHCLLFRNTQSALHSWFVFFPFIVLWLDKEGSVVDILLVKPFSAGIVSQKAFKDIIEIPVNSENRDIVGFFVGKEKDLNRRMT